MSRYSTTRAWGWNHVRTIDISDRISVCGNCGRINPHEPPASVRDERGFIDPFKANHWTKPARCSGCGKEL